MPSEIDDRIVRLELDDGEFNAHVGRAVQNLEKLENALKLDGAEAGLSATQESISNFNMDSVIGSVEEVSNHFGVFETFVSGIFLRLGSRVADFAVDLAKKATVQPLMDGLHEYETQMGAIQTIMSNTQGAYSIDQINEKLDELNVYADKTIYNFSEMTKNIGTFTAAGVTDLDEATASIQGIANLAAMSGSTSAQASTAMYQLSQAIASGTVKLMDWNSVVNAGMGGKVFQEALLRTAKVHGQAVDEIIDGQLSFRESLEQGWLTADVLTDTLQQLTMTTEGLTEAEIEEAKQSLVSQGYSYDEAEAILALADSAQEAATKVRTWTQLWDTVGESLGSGWAQSWRLIIGDFDQATEVFTWLNKKITGIIDASSNARNAVLQDWGDKGGRDALFGSIVNVFEAFSRILSPIVNAFSKVFSITGEQLAIATENFARFTEKLVITEEQADRIGEVFEGVFTFIHDAIANLLKVFEQIKIESILSILGQIGRLALDIIDVAQAIGQVIINALDAIGVFDGLGLLISGVVEAIRVLVNVAGDLIGGILEIVGPFLDVISEIFKIFSDIRTAIIETILESEGFKAISGFFENLYNSAKSFWDALLNPLGTIKNSLNDFKLNLETAFGTDRVEFFKNVFRTLPDSVKFVFDFFNNALKGLADGLNSLFGFDAIGEVVESVKAPFQSAKDLFADVTGTIKNTAIGFLSSGDDIASAGETINSSKMDEFVGSLKDGTIQLSNWQSLVNQGLGGGVVQSTIKQVATEHGISIDKMIEANGSFKESLKEGWLTVDVFAEALDRVSQGSSANFADSIREKIGKAFEYLKSLNPKSIAESFNKLLNGDAFNGFREAISKFNPSLGENFSNFCKSVLDWIHKVTDGANNFGEVFVNIGKSALEGIQSLPGIISGAFSKIGDFFFTTAYGIENDSKDLENNVRSGVNNLLGIQKDASENLENQNKNLFERITDFFGGLGKSIAENGKTIGENIANFFTNFHDNLPDPAELGRGLAEIGKGIWKAFSDALDFIQLMLDAMPTPGEIGNALGTRFGEIARSIVMGLVDAIKGFFDGVGAGLIGEAITGGTQDAIDAQEPPSFADYVSMFLDNLLNQLNSIVTDERINNTIDAIFAVLIKFFSIKIVKNISKILKSANGVVGEAKNVMESFTGLIKSTGGSVKKVGGFFGDLSKTLQEGGSIFKINTAGTFARPESKADMWLKICAGIAVICGGIWLVQDAASKGDLNQALIAIAGVSVVAAAIMALFLWMSKKNENLGANAKGIGEGFAAFGIGIAAMVGALWIFTQIDVSKLEDKIGYMIGIVATILAFFALVRNSSTNYAGVAAAAIGFSVAITLLLVPITILGVLPKSIVERGFETLSEIMVLFGLLLTVATRLGGTASQFAALGLAATLMAVAVNLLTIPIIILGALPKDMVNKGLDAVTNLMFITELFLVLSSLFVKNASTLVALGAAAVLLAVAVDLMLIPIAILSLLPPDNVSSAVNAVDGLIFVMGLVLSLGSLLVANIPNLIAFAGAMVLMAIAIDLASAPILLLALFPQDRIESAANAVEGMIFVMGLMVALMAAVSSIDGASAAGVLAMSAAMVLMAAAIDLLTLSFFGLQMVDFDKIIGPVLGIVVAFGALVAVAAAFPVAGAAMLGIGAGLALFGAACWLVAEAVNILSQSIDHFAEVGPEKAAAAGQALGITLATALASFIQTMFGFVADALGVIAGGIGAGIASIGEGLWKGLGDLGNTIIKGARELVFGPDTEEAFNENASNVGSSSGDTLMNSITGKIKEKKEEVTGATEEAIQESAETIPDQNDKFEEGANQNLDAYTSVFTSSDPSALLGSVSTEMGNAFLNQELYDQNGNFNMDAMINSLKTRAEEAGMDTSSIEQIASSMSAPSLFENTMGENMNAALGPNGLGILESQGPERASQAGSSISDSFQDAISSMPDNAETTGEDVSSGMSDGVWRGEPEVDSAMQSIDDDINTHLKHASDNAYVHGANVSIGAANGIWSKYDNVNSAAAAIGAKIDEAFRKMLKISSPSRVMMKNGDYATQGVIEGLKLRSDEVYKSASGIGSSAINGIRNSLSNAQSIISNAINQEFEPEYRPVITPEVNLSNLTGISDVLNGSSVNLGFDGVISSKDPLGLSKLGTIETSNRELIAEIQSLREDLRTYTDAAMNASVVMDSGALVGALTPGIDNALGQRQIMASRGVF